MTKRERRKKTDDGLPVNALEWTQEDWASLHRAVEQAKQEIAQRHRDKDSSPTKEHE